MKRFDVGDRVICLTKMDDGSFKSQFCWGTIDEPLAKREFADGSERLCYGLTLDGDHDEAYCEPWELRKRDPRVLLT